MVLDRPLERQSARRASGWGSNAISSATTNAAIVNWNHSTDCNWHGYIDFVYLWNWVLDLGARREIQNNPRQFVKPRLSGRTYVAYGTTVPGPPFGESGKVPS